MLNINNIEGPGLKPSQILSARLSEQIVAFVRRMSYAICIILAGTVRHYVKGADVSGFSGDSEKHRVMKS